MSNENYKHADDVPRNRRPAPPVGLRPAPAHSTAAEPPCACPACRCEGVIFDLLTATTTPEADECHRRIIRARRLLREAATE